MPGVPIQNLWDVVPAINNRSREVLGYPTAMLEAGAARAVLGTAALKDRRLLREVVQT
jgi:hypothetical protein